MRKLKLSLLLTGALLGGCATYQCPLGNQCLNVQDAYKAAQVNQGNSQTTMPQNMPSNKNHGKPLSADDDSDNISMTGTSVDKKVGFQTFLPYQGGAMEDRPVYQPPRPLRIWIAPWQEEVDAVTQNDPVLLSGQFLYATIPGHWTMGGLKDAGGLSPVLMLAPQHPKDKTPKRIQPKQKLIDMPKKSQ